MRAGNRRRAGLWIVFVVAALVGLQGCGGEKTAEKKAEEKGVVSTLPAVTTPAEAAISGTVTLEASVKDKAGKTPLLMILASTSPDPNQPAIIVKRVADATFPFEYKLTSEDITLVGSTFEGKMYVTARIDSAGRVGAAKAGTLEGTYPGNPVSVGSRKVDIVIDKAY